MKFPFLVYLTILHVPSNNTGKLVILLGFKAGPDLRQAGSCALTPESWLECDFRPQITFPFGFWLFIMFGTEDGPLGESLL